MFGYTPPSQLFRLQKPNNRSIESKQISRWNTFDQNDDDVFDTNTFQSINHPQVQQMPVETIDDSWYPYEDEENDLFPEQDNPYNQYDELSHELPPSRLETVPRQQYDYKFEASRNQIIPSVTNMTSRSLRSVREIPTKFREIFQSRFASFNAVQSACFDDLIHSNRNMVISSPTGSGKTCLMELAMIKLWSDHPSTGSAKVVYLAPTKALCSERAEDWKTKFHRFGITCTELTGDTTYIAAAETKRSDLIVATPEKWDSITRKWEDHKNFMSCVSLLLIDEVHILKDGSRGGTLEVIVTRMKSFKTRPLKKQGSNHPGENLRIVAVSATVPNSRDIALWLRGADGQDALLREFGEEYRPVKLVREVIGFSFAGNNYFAFEKNLDFSLAEILLKFSDSKPSLVFCSTRKSAINAAEKLAKDYSSSLHHSNQQMNRKFSDSKLGPLVRYGVAFHHGGLSSSDRHAVESMYLNGQIHVICTTSTLAVGVNLPAHLVVIKGTRKYENTEYVPYSSLDISQMIGRAGRPQFDQSGIAVILTTEAEKDHYERVAQGSEIIESGLHENLIEHVNAETALSFITNKSSAMEWLKSTFLYSKATRFYPYLQIVCHSQFSNSLNPCIVRIQRNPSNYKLKNCVGNDAKLSAESRLEAILFKDIDLLAEAKLIEINGDMISSTEPGKLMAKYYLRFGTMQKLVSSFPYRSLDQVLNLLCEADEFQDIRFHSDKAHLNNLNKQMDIRFPIKGRVTRIAQKVSILIQCALGNIPFSEPKTMYAMNAETGMIMQHASRIARCMMELCSSKSDYKGLMLTSEMAQCLQAKQWRTNRLVLKQVEGIGPQLARALAADKIDTFEKLLACDPRQIEQATKRNPPFGNKILQAVNRLPLLDIKVAQAHEIPSPADGSSTFHVFLSLKNPDSVQYMDKRRQLSCVFIVGISSGSLLAYRHFGLMKLKNGVSIPILVPRLQPNDVVICSLLLEEYVGLDVHWEYRQNHSIVVEDGHVPSVSSPIVSSTQVLMPTPDETTPSKDLIGIQGRIVKDPVESIAQSNMSEKQNTKKRATAASKPNKNLSKKKKTTPKQSFDKHPSLAEIPSRLASYLFREEQEQHSRHPNRVLEFDEVIPDDTIVVDDDSFEFDLPPSFEIPSHEDSRGTHLAKTTTCPAKTSFAPPTDQKTSSEIQNNDREASKTRNETKPTVANVVRDLFADL